MKREIVLFLLHARLMELGWGILQRTQSSALANGTDIWSTFGGGGGVCGVCVWGGGGGGERVCTFVIIEIALYREYTSTCTCTSKRYIATGSCKYKWTLHTATGVWLHSRH